MATRDEERHFRTVCGRFATGVTVVLTNTAAGMHGMTANAFMSVSLDPLLVAVGVHRRGRLAPLLKPAGTLFTISVLARDQQAIAEFYSRPGSGPRPNGRGIPPVKDDPWVISGACAWMECQTYSVVPAGDHDLVLGQVLRCGLDAEREPLIFYKSHYWEHLDRERDNPAQWQLLEL